MGPGCQRGRGVSGDRERWGMGIGCGETRVRETGGWGPVAGAVGRARPLWSAGESAARKCGPRAVLGHPGKKRAGPRGEGGLGRPGLGLGWVAIWVFLFPISFLFSISNTTQIYLNSNKI